MIDEIGRTAEKVEVQIEEMRDDPVGLAKSVTVEARSCAAARDSLPGRRPFVKIFVEHDQNYGAAPALARRTRSGSARRSRWPPPAPCPS